LEKYRCVGLNDGARKMLTHLPQRFILERGGGTKVVARTIRNMKSERKVANDGGPQDSGGRASKNSARRKASQVNNEKVGRRLKKKGLLRYKLFRADHGGKTGVGGGKGKKKKKSLGRQRTK